MIAGLAAIVIWELGKAASRRWRNHRHFGSLNGRYRITRKLADPSHFWIASIKVKGTVLNVEYEGLPNSDSIVGRIAMSEQFPHSGKGHYQHQKNGLRLWGFWELQVGASDTLLVHTTYADPKTNLLVTQGFIWSHLV